MDENGQNTQDNQSSVEDKNAISLLDFVYFLVRHWKLILFSTIIAAVLITLYDKYTQEAEPDDPWNLLPNEYTATAEVLVGTGSKDSVSSLLLASGLSDIISGSSSSSKAEGTVAFATYILTGNTFLEDAIEELNLHEVYDTKNKRSIRGRLQGSISTRYNEDNGIYYVSFTDYYPERATDLINKLVPLLEKRFKELTLEKIMQQKDFLEERLEDITIQIEELSQEILEFQKEYDIAGVYETPNPAGGTITSLSFTRYIPPAQQQRIERLYESLNTKLLMLESIQSNLQKQYETTKWELLDESKTFRIMEFAERPGVPSKPDREKIKIAIIGITLFGCIVLSLLIEYYKILRSRSSERKKLQKIKNAFLGRE